MYCKRVSRLFEMNHFHCFVNGLGISDEHCYCCCRCWLIDINKSVMGLFILEIFCKLPFNLINKFTSNYSIR